jgi:hypothetical protein
MPRLVYAPRDFSPAHQRVIAQANRIIAEYQAQGYDLTLRQLYYQFVSRDLIPNRQTEYKRLGSIVNDARMAGLIDWDAIVDRTRNLRNLSHWDDPAGVIEAAARSYKNDLWRNQPTRVEVWIEKDALVGVIEGVCQELDLPHFSCRGYASASELWVAGQRIEGYLRAGQRCLLLHLGDHDPSGIDMTRDIEDRLTTFLDWDWVRAFGKEHPDLVNQPGNVFSTAVYAAKERAQDWGAKFEVRRIALTREQIDQYDPPPNPAKLTDSRSGAYLELHGDESWELDALEPTVLGQLIRDAVDEIIDADQWDEDQAAELADTKRLTTAAERWVEVERFLEDAG